MSIDDNAAKSVDLESSNEEEDESDDDEEEVEDDGVDDEKRTGILRLKGHVSYRLPNGRKVRMVDGAAAYPFATCLSETKLLFFVRKSVDADRDVQVLSLHHIIL